MPRGAALVRLIHVPLLLLVLPCAGAAQRVHTLDAAPPAVTLTTPSTPNGLPATAGVFVASALLPGAGQFWLGQGRWVAYAAVEAWAWINWLDARDRAQGLQREYRDLAWHVARRIGVGERRDREFEYYEAMITNDESGAFDADPALAGVQPEEDVSTYNGKVWELARQIFFPAGSDSVPPSPQEEQLALEYYERNAITPEFAWSWGSNALEHEQFRSLIRRSDDAARAGTTILGVILVNHVVSAVDALITARLLGRDAETGFDIRSEMRRGRLGPQTFLVIELATP